jgi:hypothetical protein
MVAEASGQTELAVNFSVTMTRLDASSGERVGANGSLRIDSPAISAFGHHIEWRQPRPAATWRAMLDGQKLKFVDTSLHEFTVRLQCEERQPSDPQSCAADGDVITTVVRLTSCDDDRADHCLQSQLTVHTTVEAIISCKNARTWVEGGEQSARTGTPMRVRLLAFDVDNLPINRTRVPIEFRFNNKSLPVRWDRGSNSYAADVSADLTQFSGEYELLVAVETGWDHTTQNINRCELMRTMIVVEADPQGLNPVWLSVGSLSACAVFVGAIVFWARRMSAELRAVLVMVLTEASKTVLSISCELGDLATDLLTTYRVVFEDIVRSPQYRVPYAVFGCLAIMVGLVSLAHHVHRARGLHAQIKTNAKIQSQPAEAGAQLEDDEDDAHKAVVGKLEWELEKTSRDQQGLAVGVLCFFLEDLPMVRVRRQPVGRFRILARQVVLTALLIFKEDIMDKTVR